jgi:hypothetical protein
MEFTSTSGGCPNCGGRNTEVFHRIPSVPVNSCLLFGSKHAAQALERGDIDLSFCPECQFIFNAAWKPDRITYSEHYEETQAFSQTFSSYQKRQAEQLLARYEIFGKEIVEIGCGKGEFISLLCALGHNRGVGYDPSFVPARHAAGGPDVQFKCEFFGPTTSQAAPDLVCCKMTLEHICNTRAFAEGLRRIVSPDRGTVVFLQVPDVRRIMAESAFWDVYYEHCSYFSPASMSRMLRNAGFEVLRTERAFGDQYLTIEARAAGGSATAGFDGNGHDDDDGLVGGVAHFARTAKARARAWGEQIRAVGRAGGKVVLWGSGSKAVAFLSATKSESDVGYLVDINPHRWGKHVPGSGTQIVSPDFLADYCPDLVIGMNPIYAAEIKQELARLRCGKAIFRLMGSVHGGADAEVRGAPSSVEAMDALAGKAR